MKSSLSIQVKRYSKSLLSTLLVGFLGAALSAVAVLVYLLNDRPDLHAWHTVKLDKEYTVASESTIKSLADYLELEGELFAQLQTDIYDVPSTLPRSELNRFDRNSLADPTHFNKNWNRSFIFKPEKPRGSVLLLHGLSDSPYSLRALALTFYQQGYYVLGLRLPGNGTAPSGLVTAKWQDMASAVELAVAHVAQQIETQQPIYLVGYSMGAALAVNYSLQALQDETLADAEALVLVSPAIGVSEIAALAVWQSRLAFLFGMEKLAWNSIGPEFDPYKYTSFAINAGDQMYRLTLEIGDKMEAVNATNGTADFPRTMALLSLADATVPTKAVVTQLFDKLKNKGNELVLYDLNRHEDIIVFIKDDPIVEYRELLQRQRLNFNLSLFSNIATDSYAVLEKKWSSHDGSKVVVQTDMVWPDHIYSLSHVAMPFPPTDSLYGSEPEQKAGLHIGLLDSKGEKGLLSIRAGDLLRLRYNPFYSSMEAKIMAFIEASSEL